MRRGRGGERRKRLTHFSINVRSLTRTPNLPRANASNAWYMRSAFAFVLMAALPLAAGAQEFEVVSVKPDKSLLNSSSTHSNLGRYTATNTSLRNLIVEAYGLRDYQVEGPEWLRFERYDVAAKFPEAVPRDREKYRAALQAMLQKMLLDRFKLQTHREQKMITVYGLAVGKNGIKMKEVPDGGSHDQNSNNTHFQGASVNMAALATFLSRRMDRPVLDMTGLTGYYDFTLDWVPETATPVDGKSEAGADTSGPTITMALQDQLGLKLEARKAPIEILVVDHADKAPTEN